MKGVAFLSVFLAYFIFLTAPVLADPLEIEILNNNQTVNIGDSVTFTIELTNNRDVEDDVKMSVRDSNYGWIQNTYTLVTLEPASSKTLNITFSPTGEKEGTFPFDLSIKSFDVPWLKATGTIYMNVRLRFDIEDFRTEIDGDNLNILLVLDSTEERTVGVVFDIRDSSGTVIKTFYKDADIKGVETLSETIPLSEFLAGLYSVEARIEGTKLTVMSEFNVEPVHDVVEIVKKISTPLYEDVIITIENRGNVIEKDYSITQSLPNNDLITGFVTEPFDCNVNGDDKVCSYVLQDLTPGASTMITYRLNYWVIYSGYTIAILIVLAIATFSFIRITNPTIRKIHSKKGENKYSVILEIKNPFMHHLKNVIVRDWVSPLARVMHEEFEMLTPVMRRSDAGTELIWKLGDIKPKETRIITYKIKTLVQGSLKMPRAYIRFNNKKGNKTRVFSKHLIVS